MLYRVGNMTKHGKIKADLMPGMMILP
ncbi:protein of unknown function [Candidatus Nitrosotalea okcheonensis]|uniref:Uncharacterized protein n=1 Tax=Candidatus Nitrosotalea okcheonensis TaxID=1903276 RepID=A0A2H1FEU8_9ARCH|nr:protein of unknown function [Candidatus Nitrosotalea okcheonensis]